jgi:hypothetical protein
LPSVALVSFQPRELQARPRRKRVQRRHDPQPQHLVDDVVDLGHCAELAVMPRRASGRTTFRNATNQVHGMSSPRDRGR